MTEAQIKHMVDRFLAWRETRGASFPDVGHVEAMIRYLVEDMEYASGMRLPGEAFPRIHPDYATDGLTEPRKPIGRESVENRTGWQE